MKDVSDSTTPYSAVEHIRSFPWGVRPATEVFQRPKGATWAQRKTIGVFADAQYAKEYAKRVGAATTSVWLVRCGSSWFRIANVHAVNLLWDTDTFSVPKRILDPSIYAQEAVVPHSIWIEMSSGERYVVREVLTAKHMPPTGSRAALHQVVYFSESDPTQVHSHPLSRWHTTFRQVEAGVANG